MSSLLKPVCAKIFGIAAIGPIPIYRGSTPYNNDFQTCLLSPEEHGCIPTKVLATHFPRISIPSFSARSRVVRMQIAAPSPTPLAFPAVVVATPHSANTGFNLERDSRVTPFRIVSSTDNTEPRNSMGRISSAKIPDAEAYEVRSIQGELLCGRIGTPLPSRLCYAIQVHIRLVSLAGHHTFGQPFPTSTPWARNIIKRIRSYSHT